MESKLKEYTPFGGGYRIISKYDTVILSQGQKWRDLVDTISIEVIRSVPK